VSISGHTEVDCVVSQGCRPIGPPVVITKGKNNVVAELGGRKPLEVVQEIAQDLDEKERFLLSKGLLVGVVIDEYKDRFGRGDFLIRNVVGIDQKNGAMAVADVIRVGQTIQFHVRDAETAREDLQLLLDAQELKEKPFAGLLFTCNGRGERLFETPNHDVGVVRERLGRIPVAGFFAAGEIGPVGDGSFVHGHTASLALFRTKPGRPR
jgi:small ligand-binding sensory domain FIST